jgi:hypothetical protein
MPLRRASRQPGPQRRKNQVTTDWLPIRYRDFYDIPRAIVVVWRGSTLSLTARTMTKRETTRRSTPSTESLTKALIVRLTSRHRGLASPSRESRLASSPSSPLNLTRPGEDPSIRTSSPRSSPPERWGSDLALGSDLAFEHFVHDARRTGGRFRSVGVLKPGARPLGPCESIVADCDPGFLFLPNQSEALVGVRSDNRTRPGVGRVKPNLSECPT